MFADTSSIRARAAALRVRADEIRDEASRLVARTDAVAWEGVAADTLRQHVRHRASALNRNAALHDDAAEALDRHASSVDNVVELAAEVADTVSDLAHDVADDALGWVR